MQSGARNTQVGPLLLVGEGMTTSAAFLALDGADHGHRVKNLARPMQQTREVDMKRMSGEAGAMLERTATGRTLIRDTFGS